MVSKRAACPACGSPFKGGKPAHLLMASGAVVQAVVCENCCARGLPLVAVDERRGAAAFAPFVVYLRKLAKVYDMNADDRAVGLLQAADILEAGRAVLVDEPASSPAPAAGGRGYFVKPAVSSVETRRAARGLAAGLRKLVTAPAPRMAKPATSGEMSRCGRSILAVLVQRGRPTTRVQLSILSGYRQSGSFTAALADLRRRVLITGDAKGFAVTDAGRAAAGRVEALPTGPGLLEYWSTRLGECASTLLQVLAAAYPSEVTRDELAQRTGYRLSGSFTAALAQLRALELVKGFRASDALMESVREGTAP